MARIKITDLTENHEVTEEEMRNALGGFRFNRGRGRGRGSRRDPNSRFNGYPQGNCGISIFGGGGDGGRQVGSWGNIQNAVGRHGGGGRMAPSCSHSAPEGACD